MAVRNLVTKRLDGFAGVTQGILLVILLVFTRRSLLVTKYTAWMSRCPCIQSACPCFESSCQDPQLHARLPVFTDWNKND